MPHATQAEGTPTTTTLSFARDGVIVTIVGVPATLRPTGDVFVDGELAERIDDAASAIVDAISEARTVHATA